MAVPTLMDVIGGQLAPTTTGGDLVISVECSATPDYAATTQHDVVLHDDWSLTTPHDLDAERVLAAFGGYSSCIHLAERAAPASRDLVQLLARRVLPPIDLAAGGKWLPRQRATGCCRTVPLSREDAARHVRQPPHVAAMYAARATQVAALSDAVLEAHNAGPKDPLPHADTVVGCCVPHETDAYTLWESGIHLAIVEAIHHVLGVGDRPLRAEFYLTLLRSQSDRRWVHKHAVALPDDAFTTSKKHAFPRPDIEHIPPDVRAAWLVTGSAPHAIEDLYAAGYSAADIETLSAATDRPPAGYAAVLVGWLSADCHPSVQELLDLHAAGVTAYYRPSAPAIARAFSALQTSLPGATLTEVGLLLAVAGSVPETVRWGLAGYRDPTVVANLIKDGHCAPAVAQPSEAGTQRAHAS